jgi:hypothetical protein
VEWSKTAREQITTGAYRFLSPAVRFGARDRVTGEQIGAKLTSAALTNQPFLKGMRPVAARDQDGKPADGVIDLVLDMAAMGKVRAALGLDAWSTPAECLDKLTRVNMRVVEAGGPMMLLRDEPATNDLRGVVAQLTDLVKLSDYSGSAGGVAWAEVFETVANMIHVAIDQHEIMYHSGGDNEDEDEDMRETYMAEIAASGSAAACMADEEAAMRELSDDVQANEPNTGALAASDAINPPQGTNKDTTMADPKIETDKQLADKDTEIASLKLQLKDTQGKLSELEKTNTELAAREAERAEKDLQAEAAAIVACHAHFDDGDKDDLVALLKSSPEVVRKKWPVQREDGGKPAVKALPAKYVSLHDRLPEGKPSAGTQSIEQGGGGDSVLVMDDGTELDSRILKEKLPETVQRLMGEKKLAYDDASQEAWELHMQKRRYVRSA